MALALPAPDKPVFECAKRWENFATVRARFRKGDPWLKLETNKEGDVVISTDALRHNYQILMTALQFYGLEIAIIDQLTKEASQGKHNKQSPSIYTYIYIYLLYFCWGVQRSLINRFLCIPRPEVAELFQTMGFVPATPKQPWLDAWSIRRPIRYAIRRDADATRRGQTPRDTLHVLKHLLTLIPPNQDLGKEWKPNTKFARPP